MNEFEKKIMQLYNWNIPFLDKRNTSNKYDKIYYYLVIHIYHKIENQTKTNSLQNLAKKIDLTYSQIYHDYQKLNYELSIDIKFSDLFYSLLKELEIHHEKELYNEILQDLTPNKQNSYKIWLEYHETASSNSEMTNKIKNSELIQAFKQKSNFKISCSRIYSGGMKLTPIKIEN